MFDDDENYNPMDHFNRARKMPVFLKAQEILELVRHLVHSVENTDIKFKREGEKEMLEHTLSYMMENAYLIPAKISSAAVIELYDLKMENAALIRKAARELITDLRGVEIFGFKDIEYLDLLRDEIEKFRILFAEWVKTFDPWDYIIDRWGVFNPPGINYDDHDPDDDIPFNPLDLPDEFFVDPDEDDDDDDLEEYWDEEE